MNMSLCGNDVIVTKVWRYLLCGRNLEFNGLLLTYLAFIYKKKIKHFKLCCIHCCRVAREIPVVGIPSGNYREIPSWEILKILAQAANTWKYD